MFKIDEWTAIMRILLAIVPALAVAGLSAVFLLPESHDDALGSVLEIEADTVDVGVVQPGGTVKAEARLRNTGQSDLIVSELRSSCGCTDAIISKELLQPGEEAVLTVSMRISDHMGPVSNAVMFKTNDPEHSDNLIHFTGNARWSVAADRARVYIRSAVGKESKPATFELFSPTDSPFEVIGIRTTKEWIKVRMVTESDTAKRFEVIATPDAVGRSIDFVHLDTTDPMRPSLSLPVEVLANNGFSIEPRRLILPLHPPGKTISGIKVRLRCEVGIGTIESILADDPEWSVVSFDERNVGSDLAEIELSIQIPMTPGYQRTSLTFSNADGEYWNLPISCRVQDGAG